MTTLQFWKPGTVGPGSSVDRASESEDLVAPSGPSTWSSLGIQAQRQRLPVYQHKDEILYAVENHGVTIIHAQTGAGKTTQIPQYLYEAGWASGASVIVCTQPRRMAAVSVAHRVATEVGTTIGDEVGYTIRFEDVSDKERTRVLYVTDGILFREIQLDPLLSRFSVIMIDEAHERTIYTDLLLGILKKIRRKRPSLRLIISSATLDAERFYEFFSEEHVDERASILSLEGRLYPVEVAYLQEATADYVQKAAETAWHIHLQNLKTSGDILIFLSGREEIDRCLDILADLLPTLSKSAKGFEPLALHAGLPIAEQMKVFEPTPSGLRKVVVATNIAEASVTIDGIKFVVDSGFVKIRTYNPTTNLSSLVIVPTSKASATQRAGRAGRTSSGFCYRLYPENVLATMPPTGIPEIARVDLSTPILQLKSLGIDDLMKFDWVSNPPAEGVLRALETLIAMKIITEDGRLTPDGSQIAECPLDVFTARLLFSSKQFRCGQEILTITAMTSVQDVFLTPDGAVGALAELERRKFAAEEGDHLTLLNVYNAFTKYGRSSGWCRSHYLSFQALSRAVSIRSQLKKYMTRFGLPLDSCEGDATRLRRCLVSGYWRNVARWTHDGTYRSIKSDIVLHVHPNSILFTRKPRSGWVVFHEVEESKKIQIKLLTEIDPDWLLDYGHKYTKR